MLVEKIKLRFLLGLTFIALAAAMPATAETNSESDFFKRNAEFYSPVADSCYQPQTEISCDFYLKCVEKKQACGNDGYAIGYGHKYCSRFLNFNSTPEAKQMTAKGLQWRDHTLICLQNALVGILKDWSSAQWNDNKVCKHMTNFAFDSHPDCYVKATPSFCELPLHDWRTLISEINAKDLLGYRGLKQILRVAWMCKSIITSKLGFKTNRFYSQPPKGEDGLWMDLTNDSETEEDLTKKLEFIESLPNPDQLKEKP